MRIQFQDARRDRGSTLVLVVVLAGVAGLVAAASLNLASQRNLMATRSAAWNHAMAVAEAGIEEGLTQIQYGNNGSNGWALTEGYYLKSQLDPFGDNSAYYSVVITAANPPVITAAGYVWAPLKQGYIHRTVEVTTCNRGQFPYGMLAKGQISINGGSLLDAFDSSDPRYSTGGMYDPTKRLDNVKVATTSTISKAITISGGSQVYGSIASGPGAGTLSLSGGSAVGDASFVTNRLNAGQIEAGHSATNLNTSIPEVSPPYNFGPAPPRPANFKFQGTNYTYVLGQVGANSNYFNGSFSMVAGQSMLVTNAATFYVTGDFTISGGSFIYIAPGASLAIYVGTTDTSANNRISLLGGGVQNDTGVAANFSVNGLPSVKTAAYSGNSEFIGTCYAPEAELTLSGGTDCAGAFVAKTISLNGGMNFHYDTALGGGTGLLKYIIASWREL
jgi:hypothetical protein